MSGIYELTQDFLQVSDLIESGEYDPETLHNTLECIEYQIEEKAENYAKLIKNLEADIAGMKQEEERIGKKRKAMENSIVWLKNNLQQSMETTGKRKFKTELFSFSIQKNPPSVKLLKEVDDIPDEFLILQKPKVDTAAIKEALKEGAKIDFAELLQTESLRIR